VKKRLFFTVLSSLVFFSAITMIARRKKKEVVSDRGVIREKISLDKKSTPLIFSHGTVIPDFDEEAFYSDRQKKSKILVDKAVEYIRKNKLVDSFRAFSYDDEFSDGELYLFVYDYDGFCLAIGAHRRLLWQNLYDYQDSYGVYVVRSIIDKAKKGGGWIVYQWENVTKLSYIQSVEKDGKRYAIGCGFYPHSKRDAVVNLVNGAVAYFNDVMARKGSIDQAFSRFNYSLGSFVFGDLYLFALDFNGNIMAQGDRPGLIGQNVLEYRDQDGKYINQEIIKKLKKAINGVWVEYTSKNAPKMTYAKKVTDNKGRNYFIACGYYTTANRKAAMELVKKGFRYLEMHGVSQSIDEFTSKRKTDFRYGDLFLFLYDMKGKVIAHGGNPDFIGRNQFDLKDDTGRYFVREMIDKAEAGGGWIDYQDNNASRYVYVELVEIGTRRFVIGSGLHPISKPEMMQLLVKSAVSSMEDTTKEQALGVFVKQGGDFVKGDLSVFVFDFNGVCYAYGQDYDLIWRDMSRIKDDKGVPYIKNFIKIVKDGPGATTYKVKGKTKIAYLEKVKKDGVNYVVGSSFYR